MEVSQYIELSHLTHFFVHGMTHHGLKAVTLHTLEGLSFSLGWGQEKVGVSELFHGGHKNNQELIVR